LLTFINSEKQNSNKGGTKKSTFFSVIQSCKWQKSTAAQTVCVPINIGLLEFYLTLNHVYLQKAQLFAIFEAKF
jgi:hypothetical protein